MISYWIENYHVFHCVKCLFIFYKSLIKCFLLYSIVSFPSADFMFASGPLSRNYFWNLLVHVANFHSGLDINIYIYIYIHEGCSKISKPQPHFRFIANLSIYKKWLCFATTKMFSFCSSFWTTFIYHHHQVMLIAWSPLTLSCHPSQSFITPGWSSRLNPESTKSLCMLLQNGQHWCVHV